MEDLIAAVAECGAVDDLVPNAALALAFAAMDQIEDDKDGIMAAGSDHTAPRANRPRKQRRRREIATCAWAQLLTDPDLNDPASMVTTEFRQDFRLPYSFFPLVKLVKTKGRFPRESTTVLGEHACHPVEHKVLTSSKRASPTHQNCDDSTKEGEFMLLPHPARTMAGTTIPSPAVLTAVGLGNTSLL